MIPNTIFPQRLYLMQLGTSTIPTTPPTPGSAGCYLVQTSDGKNILIDSGLPADYTPPPGTPPRENEKNVLEHLADSAAGEKSENPESDQRRRAESDGARGSRTLSARIGAPRRCAGGTRREPSPCRALDASGRDPGRRHRSGNPRAPESARDATAALLLA